MIIWGGKDGSIIRYCQTDEEVRNWGPPAQFDSVLEFDADTNAETLKALNASYNAHTLKAGVLYRDGKPVTINPPGQVFTDKSALGAIIEKLKADQTVTAAEVRRLFRHVLGLVEPERIQATEVREQ